MQAFVGRHASFFILAAVVLVQLIFLGYQVTRKHNVRLIQMWAAAVFDPFERSLHGLTNATAGAWTSFHDLSEAERENQRLRDELAHAQAQILLLSEDGTENAHLRELLNLQRQIPYRTVAATVIAASPGTSSVITIDKGSKNGLTTDRPAITSDGILGKTVAVFPHTAQVLMITDRASGVGALLEKNGSEGVLKGDGDGLCQLDYILNENQVSPGELVVTSGLDQIYPKGLLVGRVESVRKGDIYKAIAVRPAAALDRLENVLVILQSSDSEKPAKQPHKRQ
ncbi:MAG TPA: rod shape-determining protein MreC [Terriglobia bacterium]|nr:rod shape-determining protein MreC [Terriglobia bacterium]